MIKLLKNAISLWMTNRPLLYAIKDLLQILIKSVQSKSDGGKYITETEWNKANAAGRSAYEKAAVRAGWRSE